MTNILPFPEGDYMLQLNWFISGIYRVIFKVFVSLKKWIFQRKL